MPLKPGAMLPWQKSKISKNYRYLKENMDAKDLLDYFIVDEIFDLPDLDEINGYNPNTAENRNNCFFKLLFNSGPGAYAVFLKALCENGQETVAKQIEDTRVDQVNLEASNNNDLSWLAAIPPSIRNQRLKERELSRLAQTLGQDWEMVAFDMGLSQTDIEHARMDQMSAAMRIYSCLNKWRSRVADRATFENFIKIANDCQATTINWNQIRKTVEDYAKESR